MARENLKMFTTISFYIALFTAVVFPISFFLSVSTSNESAKSALAGVLVISSIASLFAVPFSIVSMFSKEKMLKRVFALIVNVVPIGIMGYGIAIEVMNGIFQTPP